MKMDNFWPQEVILGTLEMPKCCKTAQKSLVSNASALSPQSEVLPYAYALYLPLLQLCFLLQKLYVMAVAHFLPYYRDSRK